jgi:hypothetical protein
LGGQFQPKQVVNLHWNWVVNLTVFSTIDVKTEKIEYIVGDSIFEKIEE